MAKQKKEKEKKQESHSDYPIRTLFQAAVLIAAITFVVTASSGRTTIFEAAFRSFLIFAAVAVLGGIVLVVIVMVLSDVRRKQAEEMRERMEREQREFLETQMRFQDELNKIDRDANS